MSFKMLTDALLVFFFFLPEIKLDLYSKHFSNPNLRLQYLLQTVLDNKKKANKHQNPPQKSINAPSES